MADSRQDINQKTARREFCGPDKRIPQLVMEELDQSIEDARESGNRVLKKELKRKHVACYPKHCDTD
jgi:hypothetical protein